MKKYTIVLLLLALLLIFSCSVNVDQKITGTWEAITKFDANDLVCIDSKDCYEKIESLFEKSEYDQSLTFPKNISSTDASNGGEWETDYFVNKMTFKFDGLGYVDIKLEHSPVVIRGDQSTESDSTRRTCVSNCRIVTNLNTFNKLGSTLNGKYRTFKNKDNSNELYFLAQSNNEGKVELNIAYEVVEEDGIPVIKFKNSDRTGSETSNHLITYAENRIQDEPESGVTHVFDLTRIGFKKIDNN